MIACSHLFTWSFCLIFMVGSAASLSGPAHLTSSETEVHACVHVVCVYACACVHVHMHRKCRVPRNWGDAILVPIPKKGDLSRCVNWHGVVSTLT